MEKTFPPPSIQTCCRKKPSSRFPPPLILVSHRQLSFQYQPSTRNLRVGVEMECRILPSELSRSHVVVPPRPAGPDRSAPADHPALPVQVARSQQTGLADDPKSEMFAFNIFISLF